MVYNPSRRLLRSMILRTIAAALMSPARAFSQCAVWSSSRRLISRWRSSSMLSTSRDNGVPFARCGARYRGWCTPSPGQWPGRSRRGGPAPRPVCACQRRVPGYECRPVHPRGLSHGLHLDAGTLRVNRQVISLHARSLAHYKDRSRSTCLRCSLLSRLMWTLTRTRSPSGL